MTPPAKYDLTELKTRLDIVEVARLCGLDPKKSGSSWVARCPAHNDRPEGRPNLGLDQVKGAKCFRCGWKADVIGLAVKAKGDDFGEVVDWLARLVGLSPKGETKPAKGRRSGSDLGYTDGVMGRDMYPKGEPLPPDPPVAADPPAYRIIGDPPPDLVPPGTLAMTQEAQDWGSYTFVYPVESNPPVVAGKWERLADGRIEATYNRPELIWAMMVTGYKPTFEDLALLDAYDLAQGVVDVASNSTDRPTLRVRVFEAFLGYTVPVSEVPKAAAWLRDKKGLTDQTQAAAGLRWLTDWQAADKGLKAAFDVETLKGLGLVTDKGRLRFWKHRLLFPFWVKGKPVFFAGRDIDAQGDDRRFDNLSGSVPCPYNVDDLVEARRTGRPLFVCEGYTDCLTLTQSGRLAVALGGTQGFKTAWVADFEGLDVYLAFDGDKAGREAAQKVAALFVSEGLTAPKIVKLPDGQDVTDYFTHQRSKTRV